MVHIIMGFGFNTASIASCSGAFKKVDVADADFEKNSSLHQSCHEEGRLAFSFSGAGFLFTYLAGVSSVLTQANLINPGSHLAGSSSGACLAANIACGVGAEAALLGYIPFAATCREVGLVHKLKDHVRTHLKIMLPTDGHIRCKGRTHVSITRFPSLKNDMVAEWETYEDMIDSLVASCHVPGLSGKEIALKLRGNKQYCDGAFSNFVPPVPIPGVATVGICALPKSLMRMMPTFNKGRVLSTMCIWPGRFNPSPFSPLKLLSLSIYPGTAKELRQLYALGQKDGFRWAYLTGLIPNNPRSFITYNTSGERVPPMGGAEGGGSGDDGRGGDAGMDEVDYTAGKSRDAQQVSSKKVLTPLLSGRSSRGSADNWSISVAADGVRGVSDWEEVSGGSTPVSAAGVDQVEVGGSVGCRSGSIRRRHVAS